VNNSDLCFLSIDELSRLIAGKEVSPVEVTEAYLARIERLDETLGAYATVLADEARREARAAEEEIAAGKYRGPLHGVPISLKDIFYTRGVRTAAGSLVLADFVPSYDGTVTARLREAGSVLLGKVNCYEFALGPKTPYHYGVTRNPWGLDRITGSSSSGSGVAVAAGLSAMSMGTDTGGSVRLPAAFCGTVGLKPTYGRVSRYGILPLAWSLDTPGPLTRSVADAAIVLSAIAGYDPNDPASSDLSVPDYRAALEGDLAGVRIGVPANFFFEYLDPDVEEATRAAVGVLEELGGSLADVAIPELEHAQTASSIIMLAEAASVHEEMLRAEGDRYGQNARERIEVGSMLLATDYLKSQRVRTVMLRQFERAMADVDVLVTPTTPRPAIRTTDKMPKNDGAEAARAANNRLSRPFSLLGWPTVSLTCGFSSEEMPISLQVVGRPYDEELILKVAQAYQQATEWHLRRPPVE
jgi:aspartyl-tRNA(Asn)/glutamyl-tRNA(Gln) amidotransferase subunit A